MPGLLTSFGGRIRTVIGLDSWNAIIVSNPARAFSLRIRQASEPIRRSIRRTRNAGSFGGPKARA
jgi:hypothetical protein